MYQPQYSRIITRYFLSEKKNKCAGDNPILDTSGKLISVFNVTN